MLPLNSRLLLVIVCCVALTGHALAEAPVDLTKRYKEAEISGTFECFDKSKRIPYSHVNDDYCDCNDGSDEPRTSACASIVAGHVIDMSNFGTFKCADTTFMEQTIPSHWVNDGLCDCCDGSDETSGLVSCPHVCGEVARDRAAHQKKEEEMRKTAARVKLEMQKKAVATREELKRAMPKMEKEKQDIISQLADAQKKLQALEEEETVGRNQAKAARDEYELMQQQNTKGCLKWRQTTKCDPNGEREKGRDRDCLYVVAGGHSGFCECGESTEQTSEHSSSECVPGGECGSGGDDEEDDDDDENDAVISSGEEEGSKMTMRYNFSCGHVPLQCAFVCGHNGEAGVLATGDEPVRPENYELPAAAQARRDVLRLQTDLKGKEDRLTGIAKRLNSTFSTGDLLRTLEGQVFKLDVQDYTYELRLFEEAFQNNKGGSSGTSLGRFQSFGENTYAVWTKDEFDYSRMLHEKGLRCFNGIIRSTEVHVVCGPENRLADMSEPSMCHYQLVFETPAICVD